MTTMTTETVALPRATLNQTLVQGLHAGDTHPCITLTSGAPVGHPHCLILPHDFPVGWAILNQHPDLVPFRGMKGWWCQSASVTIDPASTVEVTTHDLSHEFDEVPEEYRATIPEGARWGTLTRGVDGCPEGRFIAIEGERRGPIIMAWPGHPQYDLFSSRPGVNLPWRGWYSTGNFTYDEVSTPRPISVGDVVIVLDDSDEPQNNGRRATVVEVRAEHTSSFRVRYENGAPGGDYGWWVNDVRHATDEDNSAPVVSDVSQFKPGQLVEVHDYDPSWNGEARVTRINDSYVYVRLINPQPGQRVTEGGFLPEHVRPVTRPFAYGDRVVLVSPHVLAEGSTTTFDEAPSGIGSFGVLRDNPDASGLVGIRWDRDRTSAIHISCLRHAAPAEETAPESTTTDDLFTVGHWYAWGLHRQWYRVSEVGNGSLRFDRQADETQGMVTISGARRTLAVSRRANFVCLAPDSTDLPAWLRSMLNPVNTESVGDDVEALRRQLEEARALHQQDLDRIAEIMKEEADDRDWCSEYEDVVERIDRSISGRFRGERDVEVNVEFSGLISVPFSGLVTVEVSQSATDDAIAEAARDMIRNNGLGRYASLAEADWSDVEDDAIQIDDHDRA